MPNAGAGEDLPVVLRNVALVANDQRNDHAGITLPGQRRRHPFAQPATATFDHSGRAKDKSIQPRIAAGFAQAAHAAGGTQALLQQPGFVIEAAGVGIAMRPLQLDR